METTLLTLALALVTIWRISVWVRVWRELKRR